MVLQVGKKAPKFLLQDKDGKQHSLESFGKERVVLYFYPKDDTPGCTLEAQEFSRELPQFEKLGVAVVGISGGDNRSKANFCVKHSLKTLTLLSDSDFSVSESYGVYGEKSFMGRKYKGIGRSTFVVNLSTGLIEQAFDSVKPEGHAPQVLKMLQGSDVDSAGLSEAKTIPLVDKRSSIGSSTGIKKITVKKSSVKKVVAKKTVPKKTVAKKVSTKKVAAKTSKKTQTKKRR